jgi:uncharacterized protein YutE (UPF0331/DUF86 family)
LRGIDERLGRLDTVRAPTDDMRLDALWLDAVKYGFVTMIEGCIDVAHHIAAAERWESPDTNAAAFAVLQRHGVLDQPTAERMASAAGFRNVLVHRYADVEDKRVIAALDELDDMRSFVRQVSVWLEGVAAEPDGPHAG